MFPDRQAGKSRRQDSAGVVLAAADWAEGYHQIGFALASESPVRLRRQELAQRKGANLSLLVAALTGRVAEAATLEMRRETALFRSTFRWTSNSPYDLLFGKLYIK